MLFHKHLHIMFTAAIFTEPRKWNQLRSLSSDQWKIKKCGIYVQ